MPRFRHVDFSFEIKDPWWIKAEIVLRPRVSLDT